MAEFKKMLFLSFVLLSTVADVIGYSGWYQDSDKTWKSNAQESFGKGAAGMVGEGSGQKHGQYYQCMFKGFKGSDCWETCNIYIYCCADPAYLFCQNTPQQFSYQVPIGVGCDKSSLGLAYLAMGLFNAPKVCSAIIPTSIFRPLNYGFVTTKAPLNFSTTALSGNFCYSYCGDDTSSINASPSIATGLCSPSGCSASALSGAYGTYYTTPTNNCIPELKYKHCPNNYCNVNFTQCPKGTTFESNTPNCYDANLCAQYCSASQGGNNNPMCVCNSKSPGYNSNSCQAILPQATSGILNDNDCIKPLNYSPTSIDAASIKFKACVLTALYAATVHSMTKSYVVSSISREEIAAKDVVGPDNVSGTTYTAIW